MTILVLDPAESTGFCLVKVDQKNRSADIYDYGFIEVDKTSDYQGDHCIDLMNQIKTLIKKHKVKHVAIEDYFFSQKFASGVNVNASYRTSLHILCCQLNIPYTILNISMWKKHVAGSSVPAKSQKLKWGKEASKKLYMQQALWEKYGIRFPNYSTSLKTGKPIFFRYDIVDVVAQAIHYIELYLKCWTIECSVAVPPDVVFKKPPTKCFTYSE